MSTGGDTPRSTTARRAGTVVVTGLSLLLLAWVLLSLLELPSETSTLRLLLLLAGLVALSGSFIWLALRLIGPGRDDPVRFAITGIGLLAIGTVLALSMLPERSTGALSGAIGILPPYPGHANQGFAVGLSAQPKGCSETVPIKIAAAAPRAYWSRESLRKQRLPFMLVLPGSYKQLSVGLGSIGSNAVTDPTEAQFDPTALKQIGKPTVTYPYEASNQHDVTIIAGSVYEWQATRRPLVVTALAPWVTRRGVNDCNLQLPALSGTASSAALIEALTCSGLDHYSPGVCTDPPSTGGVAAGGRDPAPLLDVTRGVTVVTGSEVSASESDPQPTTVAGSPGWRCAANAAVTSSDTVAETGGTGGSQGDCHAVATVLASAWHRDFLLVLIGAFIAVGVHMMFQAMVEARHRTSTHTS